MSGERGLETLAPVPGRLAWTFAGKSDLALRRLRISVNGLDRVEAPGMRLNESVMTGELTLVIYRQRKVCVGTDVSECAEREPKFPWWLIAHKYY